MTDLGVMEVTGEGLLLREVAPGVTAEQVQNATEPQLRVVDDLKEYEI